MSLIRKYLEEKAYKPKMAESKDEKNEKEVEEIDTSDYKIDKQGKKYKAHKIVFNKGEDDGKSIGEELKGSQHKLDKNKNGKLDAHDFKLLRKEEMTDAQMKKREDIVKGMKKNFKSFVDKYGKDRAENVMYATATKNAMKEEVELDEGEVPAHMKGKQKPYVSSDGKGGHEVLGNQGQVKATFTQKEHGKEAKAKAIAHLQKNYDAYMKEEIEEIDLDEAMNDTLHPAGAALLKHIKPQHHNLYKPHLTSDVFNGSYKDRTDVLKAAEKAGHLKEDIDESVFDWKNNPKQTKDKNTTSTYHDVKKISTGTVYTKQFDKDGTSKGTGDDAAKKADGAPKRGRGRPKKDKFAESVEILLSLSEEEFDSMMEEGFDAFFEEFEQLDELSKSTLGSYAKKAARDAIIKRKTAADFENQAKKARSPGMKAASTSISQDYKEKSWKRRHGVEKAIDKLTK